jgi:glycosyltransferase involved in cell wall biosynthesis
LDKRITILFLIDFFATREGVTGGTERQLVQLIERMDKRAFRPIVACLQKFVNSSLWDNLDCEKYILGVYSLLSTDGFRKLTRLARFMKTNRVDILQTFFFDSTIYGIIASRLAGIKNTVSCRRDMGFWYDKSLKKKMKVVNHFTRRILVNSNAIKAFVGVEENLREAKIDVIYNGIDLCLVDRTAAVVPELLSRKARRQDMIVGIVGNFNRRVKRFDLFVKAAGEVLKTHRNVKFLVVGGGALEAELKNLAIELKIDEEVIFVGKVDDAIPYIKCFDIGVLPSDSEGFSNVLLEYMACGVPAVATRVGGNVELIEDGVSGLLVPKGDHAALANGICELIEKAELRDWLRAKARETVAGRYSWEKKIEEIQSYYFKLVQS